MKETLALIFGGQSSEHEVSCKSAYNIARNIDKEKYDVIYIGITKDGRWLLADNEEDIKNGNWYNSEVSAIISPDAHDHGVIVDDGETRRTIFVNIAFPCLHGLYGEDGTIQGLLEMAKIRYTGCGVLSSAVSMDKIYTKRLVNGLGIKQADYTVVLREMLMDPDMIEYAADSVEKKLGYPVFIKPANEGSSCGVTRADNRAQLISGLKLAADHDRKILVEEMIVGRELECAVMGSHVNIKATGVGEILAAAEFYDYDAKYNNAESKTVVDPELPEGKREEIREDARKIFAGVDGFGLSRVDFFLKEDGTVVFNEINTMPGFTNISMYPMLWKGMGMTDREIVQSIIDLAYER